MFDLLSLHHTLFISVKSQWLNIYSLQDSQLSLITSRDWCSESDRGSVSSSSASGYRTGTGAADDTLDDMTDTICDGKIIYLQSLTY